MKKVFKITLITAVFLIISLCYFTCFAAGGKVTVEAFNTAQGVHLEWNECEDAYYYEVYRQTGKKGDKLLLSKVQTTSYEDAEAESGKTYSYTVIPCFADYSTAEESDACTLMFLSAVKISSSSSERNGIHIAWKGVKNAKGYRVYRKTAEENEWMTVAKLDGNARGFTDEEISPTQQYTYCVKAFSGDSESAAGNEKQLCYIDYPEAGEIKNTSKGVHISWEEVSDAAYYMVYRKAGDGAYKPCALLDASYTGYEDKSVEAGQLYSYYICATDSEGNKGSYDRELSVRYIKKTVITAAENTAKGIKIYWSRSEGCQCYGIFKKTADEKEWKLRGVVYGDSNLSVVDSKVKNKEVYMYTVRAFYGKARAAYDDEGIAFRFYSPPEKLKVEKSDKKGNVFSWGEVDGVKNYTVYRKEGDGSWEFLGFAVRNYFTDNSVKAKKKYSYAVEVYEGSMLKSGKAEIAA